MSAGVKKNLIIVTFLAFLSSHRTTGEAPTSLHFTNILFRHGDRSPMGPFPGDLYNESAWPQGYAQLSQEGMRQEFALGQFIRQRYTGYLSSEYRRSEVYIQSSAIDRTIMSAQCVLAAVFPPTPASIQEWNPDLQWQPVPVHSIDVSNDKILHYDFSTCPTLEEHGRTYENSTVLDNVKKQHKELIDKVCTSTHGGVCTFNMLGRMYDTLLCESRHNKTWPAWMTQEMFSVLHQKIIPFQMMVKFCARHVVRLTGGMLLDKMLSDMQLVARNMMHASELKAILYSAHDTTVMSLMCALNVFNNKMVPYSTSMYVELHHTSTNVTFRQDLRGWFVQVWLRNETNHEPYILTIPGCTENCSLSRLIELTKGSIATDWIKECGYLSFPYFSQLWQIVLITVASGLGIIFLILVISSCCNGSCMRRRLRPRPSNYGKLRASEVMSRPEEMPMMTAAGDSDIEG